MDVVLATSGASAQGRSSTLTPVNSSNLLALATVAGSCCKAPKLDTLILVTPAMASFHPSGRIYSGPSILSWIDFGWFHLISSYAGCATTAPVHNPRISNRLTAITYLLFMITPLFDRKLLSSFLLFQLISVRPTYHLLSRP
ncbi:hypothetical protein ES703_65095 [subsurface metagenome]